MKRLLFLLTFSFILSGIYGQYFGDERSYKFPLKKLSSYCLSDTTLVRYCLIFKYDERKNLISCDLFTNSGEIPYQKFYYDKNGVLKAKDIYIYDGKVQIQTYQYTYKHARDKMIVYETLATDPTYWRDYIYLPNGQLDSEKSRAMTIYYYYSEGRLVKEMQNTEHTFTYNYNPDGTMSEKVEKDKPVGVFTYKHRRLVKEETFYYETDAGFNECDAQYQIRYEYY